MEITNMVETRICNLHQSCVAGKLINMYKDEVHVHAIALLQG